MQRRPNRKIHWSAGWGGVWTPEFGVLSAPHWILRTVGGGGAGAEERVRQQQQQQHPPSHGVCLRLALGSLRHLGVGGWASRGAVCQQRARPPFSRPLCAGWATPSALIPPWPAAVLHLPCSMRTLLSCVLRYYNRPVYSRFMRANCMIFSTRERSSLLWRTRRTTWSYAVWRRSL